jgi:hypothetical protein
MMALSPQGLVGRDVYARDDVKVGEVKELVGDGDYVLIKRSAFSRLVAPVAALESREERLVIGRTSSYLDMAPKVDTKRPLSQEDRELLDRYYNLPRAA